MRQVCEELSDSVHVVVKRLILPGDKLVHVVKFEEKPYVVRSEISALLWNSDMLRSMVRLCLLCVENMLHYFYPVVQAMGRNGPKKMAPTTEY